MSTPERAGANVKFCQVFCPSRGPVARTGWAPS